MFGIGIDSMTVRLWRVAGLAALLSLLAVLAVAARRTEPLRLEDRESTADALPSALR